MKRVVPWLLVGILAGALALGWRHTLTLRERLEAVRDTARVGATDAQRSLEAVALLTDRVAARGDTIAALLLTRDSLRRRLLGQRSGVTPAPRPELDPVEAAPLWMQRAEGLSAALEDADALIEADSAVIRSQAATIADQAAAIDTLTPALMRARSRLAAIDTTVTTGILPTLGRATTLSVFGEGSVGTAGDFRAEAGVQWRDVALSAEQRSDGARSLRLGVRKVLRVF